MKIFLFKNKKDNKLKFEKGFTLVELMTAVSVFIVVMTISMGSIVSIFDANRKAESLKTVMDNLNFSIESMTREMRFGKNYHCEDTMAIPPPYTSPKNCLTPSELVSFLSNDGLQIVYRKNGTQIEKSTDGGTTYIGVSAPEVSIQSLSFYVVGSGIAPANFSQPKILIKIRGTAGLKPKTTTDFTIQTLVSQRLLDI